MSGRREFLAAAAAGSAALALTTHMADASANPVGKDEILIGSLLDLSGPVVSLGKGMRYGMTLRIDEINASGGIHGRKLRLVVEDTGYDPKRGVVGAQKLLTQDRIFAMIGSIGTGVAIPTMPMCFEHGVPHMFPISAHRATFEPLHKLKFAALMPYQMTIEAGLKEMLRRHAYRRIGIIYQDDEFGLEILRGSEKTLADANMALVEKTSYKRGATDFSSQIQKLRAANVDLIVIASIVRETIGSMATARQLGMTADFLTQAVVPAVAQAGGKAVEGLYGTSEVPAPYRDNPGNPKLLNEWIDAHQARFKEAPDVWSVLGWLYIDIFAKAAERVGRDLTSEKFAGSLETMTYPASFFGTPEYKWSPTNHQGNQSTRLHQIQNGRWSVISDTLRV